MQAAQKMRSTCTVCTGGCVKRGSLQQWVHGEAHHLHMRPECLIVG